jgi:hypothetical protein
VAVPADNRIWKVVVFENRSVAYHVSLRDSVRI